MHAPEGLKDEIRFRLLGTLPYGFEREF